MIHDWHKLLDIGTETVAVCSFLHTTLPPWDWQPEFVTTGLAEFPAAQKAFYATFHNRYYRLLIYTLGWLSLAQRSNLWRFISVNNPVGPNANVPTVIHAANAELEKESGNGK